MLSTLFFCVAVYVIGGIANTGTVINVGQDRRKIKRHLEEEFLKSGVLNKQTKHLKKENRGWRTRGRNINPA